MDQEAHRGARTGVPIAHAFVHRQRRLLAVERFADDGGEKTGGRFVRLSRPHHDIGQTDADAVDKAAASTVGEHQLDHRLLGAVGGQRRQREIIRNGFRKGRAKDRDGGREYEARVIAVADRPNGLEQRPRTVEIDMHAFLEIKFGFAGDDCRQMKDHVRPFGDGGAGDGRFAKVARQRRDARRTVAWTLRRTHIEEGQLLDRLAIKLFAREQARGQLAADHSGGAGQESMHAGLSPRAALVRHATILQRPVLRAPCRRRQDALGQ